MKTLIRTVVAALAFLAMGSAATATTPAAPAATPAATAAETAKAKKAAAVAAAKKAAAESKANEVIDLLKSLETAPTAGQTLNHLVPVYRGEVITDRALAGTVIVQDTAKAVSSPDHLQAGRLQAAEVRGEVFIKNTLGQDQLHVPAYAEAQVLAAISGDIQMTEEVIRARLEDEREIESMSNPGIIARIKWWWNS